MPSSSWSVQPVLERWRGPLAGQWQARCTTVIIETLQGRANRSGH